MKVLQVFSHNAVVARSEAGKAVVLVGKGIGFNRHKGDRINENIASQIFVEQKKESVMRTG